ncbi:hypothetical protein INR49_023072 [Caranx melampygus]|nr:hypothetical protein INR49_023072 [Caranx melampygus]
MWHRLTHNGQLTVGQQVSRLRLWQCPRTLLAACTTVSSYSAPAYPSGPHQLQVQSHNQQCPNISDSIICV